MSIDRLYRAALCIVFLASSANSYAQKTARHESSLGSRETKTAPARPSPSAQPAQVAPPAPQREKAAPEAKPKNREVVAPQTQPARFTTKPAEQKSPPQAKTPPEKVRHSFDSEKPRIHAAPPAVPAPIPQIPRKESAPQAPATLAKPVRAFVAEKNPPTPKEAVKRLPSIRSKQEFTISPAKPEEKPAIKIVPAKLAKHAEKRFLPQLPQPSVSQNSKGFCASKKCGKSKDDCLSSYKKFWFCPAPAFWIPYTVFWFHHSVEIVQVPVVPTPIEEYVVEESAALDLDAVEKAVRLADLYFRAGKFDKAAASYMEAVALAPQEAELYFLLSDALFAIGDYHFAAYCIRRALELDPTLSRAQTDKREFYGDRDEFYRHLRVLERYVEEYGEDADAQLVLGYNRLFSDDPMGARRALRRVIEIQDDAAAKLFLDGLAGK